MGKFLSKYFFFSRFILELRLCECRIRLTPGRSSVRLGWPPLGRSNPSRLHCQDCNDAHGGDVCFQCVTMGLLLWFVLCMGCAGVKRRVLKMAEMSLLSCLAMVGAQEFLSRWVGPIGLLVVGHVAKRGTFSMVVWSAGNVGALRLTSGWPIVDDNTGAGQRAGKSESEVSIMADKVAKLMEDLKFTGHEVDSCGIKLEGEVGPYQFGDWLRVPLARKRPVPQGYKKPGIVYTNKEMGGVESYVSKGKVVMDRNEQIRKQGGRGQAVLISNTKIR
ncbi:hypothetical protein V6N13_111415 [Hibiscus sabdariffa]